MPSTSNNGKRKNLLERIRNLRKSRKTTNQTPIPVEAADLVCPITLELPIDPVKAMDGRVYERSAIKKYFRGKAKNDDNILSPWTREKMGMTLRPAPRITHRIETLIESGAINGDLVNEWEEKKMQQKEATEELLIKAEKGDVWAMEGTAYNYHLGTNGVKINYKEAFKWYERADQAGSVVGTANVGVMLINGAGVRRNYRKGTMYLGLAAASSSDFAAYELGLILADGKHGVPVDRSKAIYLLKMCLSGECKYRNLNETGKIDARAKLTKIMSKEKRSS